MVVCHPGMMDMAKSRLTTLWTERTRGVARPANSNEAIS